MHFHARNNSISPILETYFHHKDNFCTIITRTSFEIHSFVFISFIFNTVVCIYVCVCISNIQHDILLVTSSIRLSECKRHYRLCLLLTGIRKISMTHELHCCLKTKVIIIQFVVININYLDYCSYCTILYFTL